MPTAVGFPVLIRAFRLALSAEGLRAHSIDNYTKDGERFATYFLDRKPKSITTSDLRTYIVTLQQKSAPNTNSAYKLRNGESQSCFRACLIQACLQSVSIFHAVDFQSWYKTAYEAQLA